MLVVLCNIDRHTREDTQFGFSSLVPGQAHGTVAHHAQTKTISISFDARVRKRKMGDATCLGSRPKSSHFKTRRQRRTLGTLLRKRSSAVHLCCFKYQNSTPSRCRSQNVALKHLTGPAASLTVNVMFSHNNISTPEGTKRYCG